MKEAKIQVKRYGAAILGLGLVACSGPSVTSKRAQLKWEISAPLPESRTDYAAGVMHGRLIIAGGTYWTGSKGNWLKKQFSASTHAFDPEAGTWEELPDMPIPLGCAASAVIGDRLFVLGGYTGSEVNRSIIVLQKRENGYVWEFFGELAVDRIYSRAVSVGNLLYLVGGQTEFEPLDEIGTYGLTKTATNSLMVLDISDELRAWKELPRMPGDRRYYFNVETDGIFIWVFGGTYQEEVDGPIKRFDEVLRYNIAAVQWEKVNPLPQISSDVYAPVPIVVGNRIILMNDFRTVWEFDPESFAYRELQPLPESAFVDRFVWLNGMIVGAGGENFIEGPRRRSEWTFIGRFD